MDRKKKVDANKKIPYNKKFTKTEILGRCRKKEIIENSNIDSNFSARNYCVVISLSVINGRSRFDSYTST